jgi:hypothetical protein
MMSKEMIWWCDYGPEVKNNNSFNLDKKDTENLALNLSSYIGVQR